ncbi:serine/threonine-protein kinase gin4 [Sorochytrium milnesiophthora]
MALPASKTKNASKIGPYLLTKTLGTGSTGRVKLGTHQKTGQKVAIKIIPRQQLSHGQELNFSRKIEREITVMKLIQHPNVMGLYDVYETAEELFLVLEHVEGGELFDYLVKKGRLDEREACIFFQQIIFGLDFCHKHQICHRDLKPENLLLDAGRNIKLADFGMASLQQTGKMLETSCGSPHYASPEIIRGVKYDGALSDIWSCGVILYALLSGNLPFDDDNIRRLLSKVKTGKYFMPPHIPVAAQDLISRMLQVDPERRIRMKDIVSHPWFNTVPPKMELYKPVNEKILANTPIEKDEIDPDVIKSLGLLGWMDEEKLVEGLLSSQHNQEKIYYHLLVQRKVEYFENYDGEEEEQQYTELDSTMPRRRAESYASIYLERKKSESNLLSGSGSGSPGPNSPTGSKSKLSFSAARGASRSTNSLLNGPIPENGGSERSSTNNLASQSSSQANLGASEVVDSASFRGRAVSAGDALVSKKPKSPLREDHGGNKGLATHKSQDTLKTGLAPDPMRPQASDKNLSISIPTLSSSGGPDETHTPKFHRRKKDELMASATPSPGTVISPKRSWFAQLFNFKPEVFILSSKLAEQETVDALRPLLLEQGIKLQDGKGFGLKCKCESAEPTADATTVDAAASAGAVKKVAKFRVDAVKNKQNPAVVDIQFTLQQGPASVMSGVIATLQQSWNY